MTNDIPSDELARIFSHLSGMLNHLPLGGAEQEEIDEFNQLVDRFERFSGIPSQEFKIQVADIWDPLRSNRQGGVRHVPPQKYKQRLEAFRTFVYSKLPKPVKEQIGFKLT